MTQISKVCRAIDRYTIRIKLNYPSYELLSDLTTARHRGGRARGHRRPTATRAAGPWPIQWAQGPID